MGWSLRRLGTEGVFGGVFAAAHKKYISNIEQGTAE
jgi:hypothetical protein